jgi:hypothetical protein
MTMRITHIGGPTALIEVDSSGAGRLGGNARSLQPWATGWRRRDVA